jgi:glycosyltransferase involved in cell wall biosynthesis
MHIALYIWDRVPVEQYGGTQRIVVYLARGLAAAGHRVTLFAGAGSNVPEATLVPIDLARARAGGFDLRPSLAPGIDLLLAFAPLAAPDLPWIRSLHGNRTPGIASGPNTLYLSHDHARRHGGTAFVYNGIDLADVRFGGRKTDYDLFLGRMHRAKGYTWAIEGARRSRRRLLLAGGWRRPSFRWGIRFVGHVGGERKARLLTEARCLWMPALWDEPFGLTLVESLASGTPVLGTRRGALPEIVSPGVGALGDTVDELVALRPALDEIDPGACRAQVERHFTHHLMAAEYVRMFQAYLATGTLPPGRVLDHGWPSR